MSGDVWDVREAALGIICPRCGAKAGQVCRTVSGNRSATSHSDRQQPLLEAYGAGYEDGCAEQRRIDEIRGGLR